MTSPDVVYAHQDGASYVAGFEDDWWCWPAVADGWWQRVRCSESTAETAEDVVPRRGDVRAAQRLPLALGRLALRLSGVPTDD